MAVGVSIAITQEDLVLVRDRGSLFDFLGGKLKWRTSSEDTFTYPGLELSGGRLGSASVSQVVPFTSHDPFLIMLVEFESQFRRSALREVLRGIRKQIRERGSYPGRTLEDIVFICVDPAYSGVRFAHFREQEGRQPKLSAFGWDRGSIDETRTLRTENLPLLSMPPSDLFGEPDWTDYTDLWRKAWDVERVTEAFYKDYERVFGKAEGLIDGIYGDDKRMFTQRLFNRLLFIRFLEKKNWLRLNGRGDYLRSLWEDYVSKSTSDNNFYRDRLSLLFFSGLNNKHQQNLMAINSGGYLSDMIGDVPYLNGGLFDKQDDDEESKQYPHITVPDGAIEPVLTELFYAYNFTITESTPDDVEVAVDPEMLGKVFEELVIKRERKAKGAFYTPRTIVSFMCREALKGHLGGYEQLVDDHDTTGIDIPTAKQLLAKLEGMKVVDPACGSGAYLLGMLHELHTLTCLLDSRVERDTARDDYRRKLAIIENVIYGVDLDKFAVNVARLRLWLSLAVEHAGAEPEPLPNLDFKIECGDSLAAPDPSDLPGLFRAKLVAEADAIAGLKAQYADPYYSGDKRTLRDEIEQRLAELAAEAATSLACPKGAFDWRVQFAEVFSVGGFDVVLANPPYGDGGISEAMRDALFGPRSGQSRDIYAAFMARAFQLMRLGGMMSFITSNTWRTIRTHRPLRRLVLERGTVMHFVDVPEWVFKVPVVRTCIFTARKGASPAGHKMIAADLMPLPSDDWAGLESNLLAVSSRGPDLQTLAFARYTYEQSAVANDPNAAFFIALPSLQRFFSDSSLPRLGEEPNTTANVVVGLQTGDNDHYIRVSGSARAGYGSVDTGLVLTEDELQEFASRPPHERLQGIGEDEFGGRHFVPYDKGGESDLQAGGWLPCYYVPTDYYIDWSEDAVQRLRSATIADCKRRRGEGAAIKPGDEQKRAAVIRNPDLYFRQGITFSRTGRYAPTFRQNAASVFDSEGSGIFSDLWDRDALLAVLNSGLIRLLIKTFVNSGWHAEVNDIKRLPVARDAEAEARLAALASSIAANQHTDARYAYCLHEQKEIEAVVNLLYGLSDTEARDIDLWMCRYERGRLAEARGLVAEARERYRDHLARCERVLAKPAGYWRSDPVLQLVAAGEGARLEFKETLEVDVKTRERHAGVLAASLKTIAAFLNSDGGTLLIGVSNAGEVKGLAADFGLCKTADEDGFEGKLRSLLKDRFSPSPFGKIAVSFADLPEGVVCKVDVTPEREVVYMDSKDVYIRDGNGTRRLEGPDLVKWAAERRA